MNLWVKGIKYIPLLRHVFITLLFVTATISGAGYREIKGEIYALPKTISNRGPGK